MDKDNPCWGCDKCFYVIDENKSGVPRDVKYMCHYHELVIKCLGRQCLQYTHSWGNPLPVNKCPIPIAEKAKALLKCWHYKGCWSVVNYYTSAGKWAVVQVLHKERL